MPPGAKSMAALITDILRARTTGGYELLGIAKQQT